MIGTAVDTSILLQELEPLNSQIEQLESAVETLEVELRVVEAEFETFADDQLKFKMLKAACDALDSLQEQGAGALFWGGLPEAEDQAVHSERLRARIAAFEEKPRGINARRESLQSKIEQHLSALDNLFYEIQQLIIKIVLITFKIIKIQKKKLY